MINENSVVQLLACLGFVLIGIWLGPLSEWWARKGRWYVFK